CARDRGELPLPVVADRLPAHHPTALPGVGPIDLRMHQLDRSLEIAGVERTVGGAQDLLRVRNAPTLENDEEREASFCLRGRDQRLDLNMSSSAATHHRGCSAGTTSPLL